MRARVKLAARAVAQSIKNAGATAVRATRNVAGKTSAKISGNAVTTKTAEEPSQISDQAQPAVTKKDHLHLAEKPQLLTFRGWLDVARKVYDQTERDQLLLVAAGVAFFVMLSIFPALTALVWIFGFFADPADIGKMLEQVAFLMPDEVLKIIRQQVDAVSNATRSGFSLIVAGTMLLSLWSANAGMKALIGAMNLIYKENEKRSFFWLNVESLLFTLGALAIFLSTFALLIIVPIILAYVELDEYSQRLFYYTRWPALLAITILFLTVLNRYGPSRHRKHARWAIWGSTLGALMWLAVSLLFSFYLAKVGNLAATYGSLAAIIGLMLWLWLSASVILIGIELNAELERRTLGWEELQQELAGRATSKSALSHVISYALSWLRARDRKGQSD